MRTILVEIHGLKVVEHSTTVSACRPCVFNSEKYGCHGRHIERPLCMAHERKDKKSVYYSMV